MMIVNNKDVERKIFVKKIVEKKKGEMQIL